MYARSSLSAAHTSPQIILVNWVWIRPKPELREFPLRSLAACTVGTSTMFWLSSLLTQNWESQKKKRRKAKNLKTQLDQRLRTCDASDATRASNSVHTVTTSSGIVQPTRRRRTSVVFAAKTPSATKSCNKNSIFRAVQLRERRIHQKNILENESGHFTNVVDEHGYSFSDRIKTRGQHTMGCMILCVCLELRSPV